jgi:hypothetical protein
MPTGEFAIGAPHIERETPFDDGQIIAFGGLDRTTNQVWRGTIRIDEVLPDVVVGSILATVNDGASSPGPAYRLEASFRARILIGSGLKAPPHSDARLVKTCPEVMPKIY